MASKRNAVQWDSEPPRTQTHFIPIYSPVGTAGCAAVLLSDHMIGVWTHYDGDRTQPCFGRGTGCICGTKHLARRWKGYFQAFDPRPARLVLLELTLDALRASPVKLNPPDRPLRGLWCRIYRLRNARNAPVRLELGSLPYEGEIPDAFDAREALMRVWGLK